MVGVATSSTPNPAWRSLLHEQRYRRYFLAADARQNAVVIAVVGVAFLALVRNDFMLLEGVAFSASLALHLVHLACSIAALALLRGASSPQQHDRTVTSWLWMTAASVTAILTTRLPVGEFQGPMVGLATLVCIVFFAQRSPMRHRAAACALLVALGMVMLWNPRAAVTSAGRTTGTICFAALYVVGLFSARAFEEQRRQRVRAEHEGQCSRQALAAKVRELATEKERVEALSRARATFLATMSHEFRTPMNAVIGLSSLMLEDPAVAHREHVRAIHDSARGLLVLLGDVLDFAKIDARQLSLTPAPLELRRLAGSVGDMLRPSAAARGLALEIEVDAAVPEVVVADHARLRQVLVNLVSNAIKFTERGRVRLSITSEAAGAAAERAEATVRLAVEDTGIGMAPATLERLFEPFYQADDGIARRYGGTGLGLAISRELVRAMGSDLEVRSALGRGTTFSFELQLATASLDEPRLDTAHADARPAGDPMHGERPPLAILVVDDQAINRKVATAMLEQLGYHPDLASDGLEAIAALTRKAYDVVLMDVHMPEMSGLEATKQIHEQPTTQRVPYIVAMTASVFAEDRQACHAAGMHDFVAKPLELEQLAAVLLRAAGEGRGYVGPAAQTAAGSNSAS